MLLAKRYIEIIVILVFHFFFRICRQYDEMSDRMSEMPESTEALVQLQEYLRQVCAWKVQAAPNETGILI